jgi:hypothetical protein
MENMSNRRSGEQSKVIWMALLTSAFMYALIFSVLENTNESRSDISQWYMAGVMTMPIIIIEIVLMAGVATNRKFRTLIITISVISFLAFYLVLKNQKHRSGSPLLHPLQGSVE